MLSVFIQYKDIYITKCELNVFIGIGYILQKFGEYTNLRSVFVGLNVLLGLGEHMSVVGFLCALRAQGWGMYAVPAFQNFAIGTLFLMLQ